MLQEEHSAILSTFIKLPFVIKIFVLSILSSRLRQVLLYNGSKSHWYIGLWFNTPVNSYGHVEMISSPNHTFFSLASLTKRLAST